MPNLKTSIKNINYLQEYSIIILFNNIKIKNTQHMSSARIPRIGPEPEIIAKKKQHYENGNKIYQSQSFHAVAYGSATTTSNLKDAKTFVKQKTKEHNEIRSRAFTNPTFANQVSLCIYTLRITLTTCHDVVCQTFGYFMFMWIFMLVAALFWAVFFIILTTVLFIGLGELTERLCACCCKCCQVRPFGKTCFKAGLDYLWQFFKIMICIGFQPKKK